LVELLVVIAIIGVLVSLLLPAVQAAREAARRMNCQSNVKQLALGALNYESTSAALPIAVSTSARFARNIELEIYYGTQLSWIVRVLPFVEQQSLFQQFDMNASVMDQNASTTPERAQPASFLCPSDESLGRHYESSQSWGKSSSGVMKSLGKGNYAVYAGPEHISCVKIWAGPMIHEPQPLERITDGLSNTVMLSEVRTRDEPTDARGAWAVAWPGSSVLALDMHGLGISGGYRVCRDATNITKPYVPNPALASGSLPPNAVTNDNVDDLRECNNKSEALLLNMPCDATQSTTAAARSLHPGGVNASHVDGSVFFMQDNIDPVILGPMICIDDGASQGS
jgi:prepilin-type processing-associated H-X9-DG protein